MSTCSTRQGSRKGRWIRRRFTAGSRPVFRRAGLPSAWSPHDLRHAAAAALYAVTNDVVLAQQLLRHSDIRTTAAT